MRDDARINMGLRLAGVSGSSETYDTADMQLDGTGHCSDTILAGAGLTVY
eukprot:SAG11_NODE_21_length_25065_cov_3.589081_31_plen_50_part_00